MKKKGWDGSEETDKVQWTLAGALFYSIILITTIGTMPISIINNDSFRIYSIIL
jgi:hypothetical protein